jgi:hypothetical protein
MLQSAIWLRAALPIAGAEKPTIGASALRSFEEGQRLSILRPAGESHRTQKIRDGANGLKYSSTTSLLRPW